MIISIAIVFTDALLLFSREALTIPVNIYPSSNQDNPYIVPIVSTATMEFSIHKEEDEGGMET